MITYERRYASPTARTAHLLLPSEFNSLHSHTPTALCGTWAWSASAWWGTGSQDEYERAASLPTCKRCEAKAAPRG